MAQCMACAKEVLTYIDFDAAGAEIRRCVQCDSAVDAKLGWVTGTELAARGYALGEPPLSKGCGGGCGSCSARR
jgi:hypothetical protein